VITNRSTHSHR